MPYTGNKKSHREPANPATYRLDDSAGRNSIGCSSSLDLKAYSGI